MIKDMSTPCERTDDIKEIKEDVKRLNRSFENFRLNISVDVAEMKTKIKLSSEIVAIVISAVITLAGRLIK